MPATLNHVCAEEPVACPVASSAKDVFSSEKIYKNSVIAIEQVDEDSIYLSLYRPVLKGCERMIFARYVKEGRAPTVDSVFFLKLKGGRMFSQLFIGM